MADFLNSTGLTQVLQAVKRAVPTTLAALSDDATHRLVTDTEKSAWNNKVSNVQTDWNATTGLAAILNKPAIPTESTVAGWGFTKNAGTITGITMNGASKGTSGVVNLGTVLTEHQDISGKANLSGASFTGAVTGTSSGNTAQFRNITISTQAPSGGNNGDVWIVYQN